MRQPEAMKDNEMKCMKSMYSHSSLNPNLIVGIVGLIPLTNDVQHVNPACPNITMGGGGGGTMSPVTCTSSTIAQ